MAIERILVATDLEGKSDAALRHGGYLARLLGADLVATHVLHTAELGVEAGVHRPQRVAEATLDEARRQTESQVAAAGIGDVNVVVDVRFGDPALDIIASAVEHGCSHIVITVESRSRLGKLLMGSHAQQIILDSDIPVIAVRPTWRPAEAR